MNQEDGEGGENEVVNQRGWRGEGGGGGTRSKLRVGGGKRKGGEGGGDVDQSSLEYFYEQGSVSTNVGVTEGVTSGTASP